MANAGNRQGAADAPGSKKVSRRACSHRSSASRAWQEEFSARFKGSPIKRAKRRGLLRNVAIALGNWGAPEAVPALAAALHDEEPLVRGHAAWALGRIPSERSVDALRVRLAVEGDGWVISEIQSALDEES